MRSRYSSSAVYATVLTAELDEDADKLAYPLEYAGTDSCNAYASCPTIVTNHPGVVSGWYNKFFPTDPWDADTDGDGVVENVNILKQEVEAKILLTDGSYDIKKYKLEDINFKKSKKKEISISDDELDDAVLLLEKEEGEEEKPQKKKQFNNKNKKNHQNHQGQDRKKEDKK